MQRSGISKRGSDRKVSGETAAARPKGAYPRRTTPADYEEIFAYGDTPKISATLALATTKIYRWMRLAMSRQRQATQVKMARDCPSHRKKRRDDVTLTTPRLLLRRFRTEDLPSFSHYRNLPEVARFQSWTHYSMAEATAFYEQQQRSRWPLLRMKAGSSLP